MASTLKDVARLASVSVRTVSNVINRHPHVSDTLRRRVEAAVEELAYRPDPVARSLRSRGGRSVSGGGGGAVALVLPDADADRREELARRVVQAAVELGYVPVTDAGTRPCLLIVT